MKTKQRMRMEIKEISAEGSFEGILSPYNVIDDGKDMVEPGAFTKTIQEHGSEVPLLWQHKSDVPVGKLTLQDGPDALRVKGQLLMDLPEAQKAYLLIKARIVKGLSIGFNSVKDAVEGGVRHLKELRLYEGSIVTFPMAETALITSVKARRENKADFNTELAEVQLRDAGYQMFNALQYALGSLPWASGMTPQEKVAAAEVTLQQFTETFLAYLPAYIDYLTEEYGAMESMSTGQIETKRMERKAGRTISAATKTTLTTAHDHLKSATDLLSALISPEADSDTDTSDEEAAKAARVAEEKARAGTDHSAALTLIDQIRECIPA